MRLGDPKGQQVPERVQRRGAFWMRAGGQEGKERATTAGQGVALVRGTTIERFIYSPH